MATDTQLRQSLPNDQAAVPKPVEHTSGPPPPMHPLVSVPAHEAHTTPAPASAHVQLFGGMFDGDARASDQRSKSFPFPAAESNSAVGLIGPAAQREPAPNGPMAVDFPLDGSIGKGPLPQDPPSTPTPTPNPPYTGEPIKLPPRSGPPPVPVIDASPPADAASPPSGVGFPKCSTSDNVKHILEVLAGGVGFGLSLPAEIASLGAATPGLIGGAYAVYDGMDELRKCK